MPEYLILKLEGDSPRDATITAHVVSDDEPEKAIKQGYVEDGRYAILNWDERVESDLAPGPVKVTAVEGPEKRAEARAAEAEAEAEAAKG